MTKRIIGNYELQGQLGKGGMGVVYKATDLRLGRTVALKFLPFDDEPSEKDVGRFQREAVTASSLDHPNICTIHEVGQTEEGESYLVMACYEGRTFRAIGKQGPVDPAVVVELLYQTAEGLKKAHSNDIVHRDIKPGNLILTDDGIVKILDFGLARFTQQTAITGTGQVVGTVAYMAPEQIQGDTIDHRVDIWSLGVVGYELLAGKRPFGHANIARVLHQINNEEAEPIHELQPEAPEALLGCISKAMQRDPTIRYQHMSELLNDLYKTRQELALKSLESSSSIDLTVTGLAIDLGSNITRSAASENETAEFSLSMSDTDGGQLAKTDRQGETVQGDFDPRNIEALAVLPFENLARSEDSFFVDGLTEELIHALSVQRKLRITSRNSVYELQRKQADLAQVREALGVDAVIEGTVRQAGNRIRVVARLVSAHTGQQIWSEKYDRELEDVFEVQDEIVAKIHHRLELELESAPSIQIRRGPYTGDQETYELYLRGRHYWHQRNLAKSLECYEQAIEQDPDFALAHAGLANHYASFAVYGGGDPNHTWPKVRNQVLRALELEYNLPDAHVALGLLRTFADWDWKAANRALTEAVRIAPESTETNVALIMHYLQRGDLDAARGQLNKVKVHDPLSPIVAAFEVGHLVYARRYEEAVEATARALDTGETLDARLFGAMALDGAGKSAEAIEALQQIFELTGQALMGAFLAAAQARDGQHEEAQQLLSRLEENANEAYVQPSSLALVYGALGDNDRAFAFLDEAIERKDTLLCYAKIMPYFDPLRSDDRFQTLLERIGLADSSGMP